MSDHNTSNPTSALGAHSSSSRESIVTPKLQHASEQIGELAHQSLDAIRDATDKIQAKVRHTGEVTAHYIQHDPIKAMLMSAAAGAALMALVTLVLRSQRSS